MSGTASDVPVDTTETPEQPAGPLPSEPPTTPGRTRLLTRAGQGAAALLLCLVVAALNGMLPGQTNSVAASMMQQGFIHCVAEHGLAAARVCPVAGAPRGLVNVDGVTPTLVGAAYDVLPLVSVRTAYFLLALTVVAASLAGSAAIARRLGAPRAVGLVAGAVYLVAPTVPGMAQFGPTGFGFMLLPAALAVSLRALDAWSGPRRDAALWALLQAAAITALLFTDGYAYVVASLVSACVLLSALTADVRRRSTWLALASFAAAVSVATVLYRTLLPGEAEQVRVPVSFFRAMGLDLVTLWQPSPQVWWASRFGIADAHRNLWGDGSNAAFNYVGLGCLVLAVLGVRALGRNRVALGLLVGGLACLLLAIGPSVKIDDQRPPLSAEVTYQSYLMPAPAASLDLHDGWVYTSVPGVSSMRATYRWFTGTRLVLVLLAAAGFQRVLTSARRSQRPHLRTAAVVTLGVVAVAELLPPVRTTLHAYAQTDRRRAALAGISDELDRSIAPGARVLFVPANNGGNDMVVNYFAATGSYRTFNVGGDKALVLARQQWPADIRAAVLGKDPVAAAERALRSGQTDVVVVPRFDLRWNTYSWPPGPNYVERGDDAADRLATAVDLSVDRHPWFYVVTLRR